MKVMTIDHCSSNLNLTHGVTREVAKPQRVVAPQIKKDQLITTKIHNMPLKITLCNFK
jgi:hypothetical protein